jgi:hypothetical protein
VHNLRQHCKQIKASFERAYVSSLFKSLQLNHFIHAEDVTSAVADCDETSVEIDLTRFVKAVCAHLKEFWLSRKLDFFSPNPNTKSGAAELFSLGQLRQLDSCTRLKNRHARIKEQFLAILIEYFRSVPSNPRFFYSIPRWERDQQVQNSYF